MATPVLYTCIVNGRDAPKRIWHRDDFRYVLFTDDPTVPAPGWEVQEVVWRHRDPTRTARFHKHHPHLLFPEAEVSVWIDGTLWPKGPLAPLLRAVDAHPVAAMRHPSRTAVAEEAACARWADDPAVIRAQVARYARAGFPDDGGLFVTNALVRRHGPDLARLQDLWWAEIRAGSKRDQLSFTYCLWRLGLRCRVIPGDHLLRGNPYFGMRSHYNVDFIPLL